MTQHVAVKSKKHVQHRAALAADPRFTEMMALSPTEIRVWVDRADPKDVLATLAIALSHLLHARSNT